MGKTEDEMLEWHHRFNGTEFEQSLGAGEEQGSLACCSLQDRKEFDMTEQLIQSDTYTHAYICVYACVL